MKPALKALKCGRCGYEWYPSPPVGPPGAPRVALPTGTSPGSGRRGGRSDQERKSGRLTQEYWEVKAKQDRPVKGAREKS